MKVQIIRSTPDPEYIICYCARASSPKNQQKMIDGKLDKAGLLKYLIREKHWSPFEMAHVLFEIDTTRAISAQLLRHRSFSFQEFSQRYATIEDDIPTPEMRLTSEKNRQSSTITTHDYDQQIRNVIDEAHGLYDSLIGIHDIAPETARMILPMCTPTKLYMNGTIRSWIHYVELRCQEDTQKEHREIALAIRSELSRKLPICAEAFGWND